MHPDHNAPPLNPLPPVVWLMVIPVVAVELFLSAGARGLIGGPQAIGWRLDAIRDYSVFGAIVDWMVVNRQLPGDYLLRFVAYPFVHSSFTHALFVVVFLLAMGKFVGEVFRAWAVLAVFFGASILGAVAYGALLDDPKPLYGGYPGAYGLIGAFTFILWTRLGALKVNRGRAFLLIGILLIFQLSFGLVLWLAYGVTGNDWVAELTGFATGFGLSFVVCPGGWGRVLEMIRQP